MTRLLALLFLSAGASAQTAEPPHVVPFGSRGNAIELAVGGLAGNGAEVVVASAPAWLAFDAASVSVEGEEPVARLAFDAERAAPVGAPASVEILVRSQGAEVARHTVRLVIEAPAEVTLATPFPNPARGRVAVPFELPREGRARVSVVDVLGREVAVLVDAEHETGAHTAALPAGSLAPGVYLVRLVAGGEVRVRQITVVR